MPVKRANRSLYTSRILNDTIFIRFYIAILGKFVDVWESAKAHEDERASQEKAR